MHEMVEIETNPTKHFRWCTAASWGAIPNLDYCCLFQTVHHNRLKNVSRNNNNVTSICKTSESSRFALHVETAIWNFSDQILNSSLFSPSEKSKKSQYFYDEVRSLLSIFILCSKNMVLKWKYSILLKVLFVIKI